MALYTMRGRFVFLAPVQCFMLILLFYRRLSAWPDSKKRQENYSKAWKFKFWITYIIKVDTI